MSFVSVRQGEGASGGIRLAASEPYKWMRPVLQGLLLTTLGAACASATYSHTARARSAFTPINRPPWSCKWVRGTILQQATYTSQASASGALSWRLRATVVPPELPTLEKQEAVETRPAVETRDEPQVSEPQMLSEEGLLPVAPDTARAMIEEAAVDLMDKLTWPPKDEAALRLWVNLMILAVVGAGVFATLITVDIELWRGWTLPEILFRIPYDNWNAYEGGLSKNPILTKTIINVVIYLLGDWMAQVDWGRNGKNVLDFDLARTLRNGLIGAFFGPLVHWYYEWSDWVLPMELPINRVLKILMDQTIYLGTKCSVYIALVGLLRGDEPGQVQNDVKERIWPIVSRAWRFWPLAHCITYGVIPPRHRVLWVNLCDVVWGAILASLASRAKKT